MRPHTAARDWCWCCCACACDRWCKCAAASLPLLTPSVCTALAAGQWLAVHAPMWCWGCCCMPSMLLLWAGCRGWRACARRRGPHSCVCRTRGARCGCVVVGRGGVSVMSGLWCNDGGG
jgi:hypothetical protein